MDITLIHSMSDWCTRCLWVHEKHCIWDKRVDAEALHVVPLLGGHHTHVHTHTQLGGLCSNWVTWTCMCEATLTVLTESIWGYKPTCVWQNGKEIQIRKLFLVPQKPLECFCLGQKDKLLFQLAWQFTVAFHMMIFCIQFFLDTSHFPLSRMAKGLLCLDHIP